MPTLEITGLNFNYGSESWGLRQLDLAVDAGEIVCILGASGCGKSTLLNLIAGLLQPQSGAIKISEGRPIGYIFQSDPLFPWRTVQSNLLLARDLRKGIAAVAANERIAEYLQAFHLSPDVLKKYPKELSGGMRQRVAIILSLMFDPSLLLMDEPFSALDFYTKLRLEDEFYHLIKMQGKAAIIVTHDIEEAIAVGDRVLIMSKTGEFHSQYVISDLADPGTERLPEAVRGSAKFAEYYRQIWDELKTVIGNE